MPAGFPSVGDSLKISINLDATFQANNTFSVWLPDSTGSFTNVKEIGKSSKQIISTKLPVDISGGNYRIKVTSTNPVLESQNMLLLLAKKSNSPVITSSKSSACVGVDSVTLTAQGCSGGQIAWSNALQGSVVKTLISTDIGFSATCTLSGCMTSSTSNIVKVAAIALPIATATNNGPYFVGDEIKLSGGGGTSYEWKVPNNFSSTLQNPSILKATINLTGSYSVKVTNNTCSATAQTDVKVNPILGNETPFQLSINLNPNPANEFVKIDFQEEGGKKVTFSLTDVSGKLLVEKQFISSGNFQQEIVDTKQMGTGQYLARLRTSTQVVTKKIVIIR